MPKIDPNSPMTERQRKAAEKDFVTSSRTATPETHADASVRNAVNLLKLKRLASNNATAAKISRIIAKLQRSQTVSAAIQAQIDAL